MPTKRLLVATLLLPLAAACKGDSTGGQPVGSVRLSQDQAFVAIGDTLRLTASVLDPAGTVIANPRLRWESTNPTVATVSGGLVTGRAAGSAQIIASAGGMADTTNVTVIAAAALRTFNVNPHSNCANPVWIQARRVATAANVHFYHDLRNPAGQMTDADYQVLANRFQNEQFAVLAANFGAPSDLDGNGAVVVLYTRAVNELTPANVGYVIGGFFYARDLFPRVATPRLGACAGSNEAEMFYMLAEDPEGEINNNRRNADQIRRGLGTLGHEFQHLINASRRLHVNSISPIVYEATWLDEGLAHIAEELIFYHTGGVSPRQNLSLPSILNSQQTLNAFNDYSIQNMFRLGDWMRTPAARSPFGNEDDLATRGAAWSFLRYAADRRGGNDQQLWHALVNSSVNGFNNLNQVFGWSDPLPWFQDWGVAMYADDAVPGVAARFTQPSWNFRSVLSHEVFGGFPLSVETLTAGTPRTLSLRGGSSAYLKFGVAAGAQADIRITAANTTQDGACTTLNLAVGEVHQATASTLPAFCVTGGGASADYVLIPFHASTTGNATVDFTVLGTGIVAPTGPPTPDRAVAEPRLSRGPELVWDHTFERNLRMRERLELEPLIRDRAPEPALQMDLAPPTVRYSVVRTR